MQLDKGVGSLGVDSNRRSLWVVEVLFCKLDGDNNRRSILVFWGTGPFYLMGLLRVVKWTNNCELAWKSLVVLFGGSVEGGQMVQ